jgi:hypothetical protein
VQKTKPIFAAVALALVAIAGFVYYRYASSRNSQKTWNADAITARYVSTQLKQVDSSNARLLLSYDLENNTNTDYRLAEAPGLVIMSRLQSDGSLSSQEDIRLSYPTFLPAGQRARISLQLTHALEWPPDNDPTLADKLRDFVNQELADVQEFVLFDQTNRRQIEFPRGWQRLTLAFARNNS